MEAALALFGGIVLIIIILFVASRSRAILKANKMMENVIRLGWLERNIIDPVEQDDFAIETMQSVYFTINNLNDYRLALGALRSLSRDIVKDEQRLEQFKRSFILFGQIKGWTNL